MTLARAVSVGVVAGALLAARNTDASPGFSEEVTKHLALTQPVTCALCHAGGDAGTVDATQPFARSLVARGLVGGDVGSLDTALDALRTEKVDSDGDGAIDTDELSWGGDPNHADVAQTSDPPAEYGCSAKPGLTPSRGVPTVAMALGLVVALRRRRRP